MSHKSANSQKARPSRLPSKRSTSNNNITALPMGSSFKSKTQNNPLKKNSTLNLKESQKSINKAEVD